MRIVRVRMVRRHAEGPRLTRLTKLHTAVLARCYQFCSPSSKTVENIGQISAPASTEPASHHH